MHVVPCYSAHAAVTASSTAPASPSPTPQAGHLHARSCAVERRLSSPLPAATRHSPVHQPSLASSSPLVRRPPAPIKQPSAPLLSVREHTVCSHRKPVLLGYVSVGGSCSAWPSVTPLHGLRSISPAAFLAPPPTPSPLVSICALGLHSASSTRNPLALLFSSVLPVP